MKPTIILLLIAILAFQTSLRANEIATNSPADSKAEQMKALRKEVDDAEMVYVKAADKDEDSDQTEKLWNKYKQINQTNFPKIFELARQQPKSEAAFETFAWIVTNRFSQSELQIGGVQSVEFLRDYHATNPNIAAICRNLGAHWEPTCQPVMDFLRIAADKNPDRESRGQAILALARLEKEDAENLEFWNSAPHGGVRFEKLRSDYLENAKSRNPKTLSGEAEKLFNEILNQYADCPTLQPTNTWQVKTTLGEVAKAELYELNYLSPGKTAPEIVGEGIDGKKLKLSDYQGKIVMLSFWASWCGPCVAMLPSEVRLVERMKGKPFALVGVNGDGIRDDAKNAVEKEKMTWPSFWNIKGPDGPIPTAWNVHGWPTIFVLDANGVIRFKLLGYGQDTENLLSQKVDSLVNQLENKTHS